jgi:hypothetical protein
VSGFSLRPYEDQLPGVQYRDGILRLRPTRAATIANLGGLVLGVLAIVVGIGTHRVLPVIFILPLIAGPVLIFHSLRYFRCKVVCEERTIVVVNKRRSFAFDVDEITAAGVVHFEPSWFWPYRTPTTLWPKTLAGCRLIKRDGSSVLCDALVGSATDSLVVLPGDVQPDYQSPIEAKAHILQRWIESLNPVR